MNVVRDRTQGVLIVPAVIDFFKDHLRQSEKIVSFFKWLSVLLPITLCMLELF